MKSPRQTYTEALEQLEREARITISVTVALPDGTTAVADWPHEWEAPTYACADTNDGADLATDLWELAPMAMGQVAEAKLGPYPPPSAEDVARRRAGMVAMGIDPDAPDAPLEWLKAILGDA